VRIKVVKAEESVGLKLAYDVSIATRDRKGALFRRGHIIRSEDVEKLKNTGHYYVYVEDDELEGDVHETEAVVKLAEKICGDNVYYREAEEGKAVVKSLVNGVLVLNENLLYKVNNSGVFVVVSRSNGAYVRRGDTVAVVDLIPLYISRRVLDDLLEEVSSPIFMVKPIVRRKVGLVVTGTEIYEGRIKDEATGVVESKVEMYGGELVYRSIVPDNVDVIEKEIMKALEVSDIVITTGGMSVDPTDLTPKAIASVADEVVAYGVPFKPNTMTMIAYRRGKPIIGVSGCIVYFREFNILDALLPKLMANLRITREEIARMGNGGLSDYFIMRKKM